MVVSFRYQGGKSRIVNWLKLHFPSRGRIYLEPFAGRANVFFGIVKSFSYQEWRLNDCNTANFLKAIKEIDLKELDKINNADWSLFYDLSQKPDSLLAEVMAPIITFAGKGYKAGYVGETRSIDMNRVKQRIKEAKILLQGVRITDKNYINLTEWRELDERDFVYCDPGYTDWQGNAYGNIYHPHLLELLTKNSNKFRWALSGYDNELYQKILGKPCYKITRDFPMMNLSLSEDEKREECLWTSHYH